MDHVRILYKFFPLLGGGGFLYRSCSFLLTLLILSMIFSHAEIGKLQSSSLTEKKIQNGGIWREGGAARDHLRRGLALRAEAWKQQLLIYE